MKVRPLGDRFGAEISDIDLSADLDPPTWARLHRAYLDHKVLVFPDQHFTAHAFAEFGRQFGALEPHTVRMYRHPEIEGITVLSNRVEMGRPVGIRDAGSWWHSDYSYRAVPANVTILWSIEIPSQGGDTWFADLTTAYAALPEDIAQQCVGKAVRQQYRWTPERDHPESRWQLLSGDERAETPEVRHPLVRTHPETGARALYVSNGLTTGIIGVDGMVESESEALLERLYRHCEQSAYHYRHVWRTNEVVLWDNRAVMHRATTRELGADKPRTLWRINTRGSVPV